MKLVCFVMLYLLRLCGTMNFINETPKKYVSYSNAHALIALIVVV